jgi:peroxiredoxin Q/BCP
MPVLLKEGAKAPAFSLMDQGGRKVALKDFAGKKVLLYFYPKDMTPGCTREAQGFQQSLAAIRRKGTVVIGVSKDTEASHKKFCDKYGLQFPLLADVEGVVVEKYGVWQEKNMYGKKSMGIVRTTYVIDEAGKIAKVFPRVKVDGHLDQVLEAL